MKDDITAKLDRESQIKQLFQLLKTASILDELDRLEEDQGLSKFQKDIVKDFRKLYTYVNGPSILAKMESTLLKSTNKKSYNRLISAANFSILPDQHIIQQRQDVHFPVGPTKLPKKVVFERMKAFLAEIQSPQKISSERKAVSLLNLLRRTYRKRDKMLGDVLVISGNNPADIQIEKKKPNIAAEDVFLASLLYDK